MAISFNAIPTTLRVPFCYVEFDNSQALTGPALMVWKVLMLGIKTAGGTATANVPVQVTSAAQAETLFGIRSQLAAMCRAYFANNTTTALWCVPMLEVSGGTKAAGTVTFLGTASAAGTLSCYIGGVKVDTAITNGMTAAQQATAFAAAVEASTRCPVNAAVDGSVTTEVDLSAVHKGVYGNDIDVRLNYADETTPAGMGVTIVALSGGASNPTAVTALDAIGDERYHAVVMGWNDATNIGALETELATRWGPLTQNDGHGFIGSPKSHADAITLGSSRNSPHLSILSTYKSPTPCWEAAAALGAVAAYYASIDPARPLQRLTLTSVKAPAITDRFTQAERNLLLFDGISTTIVDAGGNVLIERVITTYQTNSAGADDVSYLDVETMFTLSYIRYDFRTYFLVKYPRHKLADDGTRYGAGQAIITPKIGRSEAIIKFRQWEEIGLVENIDQFKADLIVERNVSDRNRLDFYLPPDLINQFRVAAAKIAFRL